MSGSAEAAPSTPIIITSDDDLDAQATANGWSGDGTAGTPYIIGGLEIDATGYSYAIYINNVNKHLVITECILENANHVGIEVWYSSNIWIQGNTIRNNADDAITLYSCNNVSMTGNDCWNNPLYGVAVRVASDIEVVGNYFTNSANGLNIEYVERSEFSGNLITNMNGAGIYLDGSGNNTVFENKVNNSNAGIVLYNSYFNSVHNNTCDNNDGDGISLSNSHHNTIENNLCSNNSVNGIAIYSSEASSFSNNITNNLCFQNGDVLDGAGIYLTSSSSYSTTGNTIFNNTCDSNNYYGIWVLNSPNNIVLSNTVHNSNGSGILIQGSSGSNASFNYLVLNGDSGIWLDSSDHCLVQGNTGELNTDGIYLSDSDLNELSGNDLDGNTFGLFLYFSSGNSINENNCTGGEFGMYVTGECHLNVIDNNTCSGNIYTGILLDASTNNSISNNTCSGNNGIAIESSANTTVSNNTCTGGYDGISISNSPDSLIVNNTCTGNYDGISVFQSSNCTIADNLCDGNTYGILLSNDCDDNILIENICGSNALQGITVGYSDRNLLLNNTCNLNGQHGIIVGFSANILINNTCHDNGGYGILLENAQHILVQMNTCTGNAVGIRLQGSTNNTLEKNDCSYNNVPVGIGIGISLRESHWNTVANNSCLGNWQAGIKLESGSGNNTISGNALSVNGIYGMSLYGSDNNRIVNNILADNVEEGLFLTSSNLNSISGNIAVGNNGSTSEYDTDSIQAYDDGTNFWNATAQGNLWGDWTSPDANGDGIVDEPYLIGGGNSRDQLPLALGLVITSPVDGYVTDASVIDLSGSTISYLGATQVRWSNAATSDSGICLGTDPWNATVPLAEGLNLITVTMTGPSGMVANAAVTVIRDNTPPTLTINSPTEGAYVGSSVTVTWTGSDSGSGIAYYIVSIEGMFFDNVTGSSYTIIDLADGTYTFLVSAYDMAGNYLDVPVTFTVDVTAPTVNITSPANNFLSTSSSVMVTWTGSDVGSGVDRYEVSWEGGSPVTLLPSVGSYAFNGLSDGSHLLTVVVYDMAGLSHIDTVTILVDTQAPSLTITSPVQDGFVNVADVMVTWSGSDAGTGIAYYIASIEGLPAFNTTGNLYTFNDLADGTYTVLVSAYDHLGNYRDVTVTFTVDTMAPTLVIDSPLEGQLFNVTSVNLSWNTTDANPGTVQVRFDGEVWALATGDEFVKTGLTEGQHTAYVKATDAAGNSVQRSVNFTVDTTVPYVAFISPGDGSLVNSSTGIVEWTLNEGTSSIRVDEGDWIQRGSATSWTYTLEDGAHIIEVRVIDMAGNFATATLNITVDTVAPEALVSPIGDDLELDLVILVEFSEQMNQTSVSIVVPGVTGTLEWEGNAVMFTPSALYYNHEYTVQVSGKDLAGNTFEANWTFATRSVGNLTGSILDENGDPVANVTVTAGGEFTAKTDENGRFVFLNLSVGTYMFEVDAEGYEPFTFNATVEQGITVDEGTVEMVPEGTEGEVNDDGISIWLYVIIAIVVLVVVGVAAFVFLRKK